MGGRSQEEGEESENHCVPEAQERKKWSNVSNAEREVSRIRTKNSLLHLVTRNFEISLETQIPVSR